MLAPFIAPPPGHAVGITDPYGDLPLRIPDPHHHNNTTLTTVEFLAPAIHDPKTRPAYPVTHDKVVAIRMGHRRDCG